MLKYQKNKNIFLWQKFKIADFEDFILKKYIENLFYSFLIIYFILIAGGFNHKISFALISSIALCFFLVSYFLFKKNKIKLRILKILSFVFFFSTIVFALILKTFGVHSLLILLLLPVFTLLIFPAQKFL